MLIEKELIQEAKEKLGDTAAQIIREDLELENFDEKNYKCCCPFHEEDTPSFIWNPKEFYFHCFGCGKNYGIIDHYQSFYNFSFLDSIQKLFELVDIPFMFGEKGIKQNKKYSYPYHVDSKDRTQAESYLELRGISKKTLDYCDVQQEQGNIVFHFYDANDVLLLVKYRPARKISKNENKEWCQPGASTSPILFNMNKIDPSKPLVITEGEIDCLSVIEAGYQNCVSIPLGALGEQWIEFNWDWLEQFDKIIIWSDNDSAGINMRKNVCGRLGTYRAYFVELPNVIDGKKVKDANEVLYHFGKEAVIDFIENANEIPVSNVVDLSEVTDYDIEHAQGLYTGIQELDKYIYKIVAGTLSIWTGVNSSGKSVLTNQIAICESLNQGYDVFSFSGELSKPLLKNWIERTMAGTEHIEMNENFGRKIDKDSLLKMRNWYKKRLWIYDNDRDYTATSILNKMEELARKWGVKVFVIDNLMMVDLECSEKEKWNAQKLFVLKLVNFASKYNVFVHLVAHPRKVERGQRVSKEDVAGSGDITNLAHYVFAVHRYKDIEKENMLMEPNKFNGKIYDCCVSLFKNRITGTQDKEIQTWFDTPSYRFYSNTNELYKRYKWNDDNSPLPTYNPKDVLPEFMQKEEDGG